MPNLGMGEMIVIFLIVLIIFGPKSLPKIGQALGKGIREFKDAARGMSSAIEEEDKPIPPKQESSGNNTAKEPAKPAGLEPPAG
jgi:sec-independent protein translocase protein TatA